MPSPSLFLSLSLSSYSAEQRNRKLKPCTKFRFSSEPEPLKCCPTAESLTQWIVQEGSVVNCFIVLRSLCTYTCEYKPRVPAQHGIFSSGNLPYILCSYEFSTTVLRSQNIWLLDSQIGWQVSAPCLETHWQ